MRCTGSAPALVVATVFTLGLMGCDGNEPTVPQGPGTIQVSVQTTGGDLDDLYEISAGGQHRMIGSNGGQSFSVLSGSIIVELSQINANCSVAGSNRRTVQLDPGASVSVAFEVTCDATGLQVSVRTTGPDQPAVYPLRVDGVLRVSVPANGSATVSRLSPGAHLLLIEQPAPNCSVAGDNPRSVTVTNRTVSPVSIDITCVAAVREEIIVFRTDTTIVNQGLQKRLSVVRPDGTGQVQIEFGHSPDWAPDGKSVVFSNADCYLYYSFLYCYGGLRTIDPESRRVASIATFNTATSPAWSPTGDVIAYVELTNETLYLIAPSGAGKIGVVVPTVAKMRNPSWSPDGQRLALACGNGAVDYNICIVRRDGTGYVQITSDPGVEDQPAWSPDGLRIAFTITPVGSTRKEIALVSPTGGAYTRITDGFDPAWSRDGTKLVFAREDGLFTINPDGTNLKRLTTGVHREPAWRP